MAGKTVIVIDDGLATGATMHAALMALRKLRPAQLVVAVPVAAAITCYEIGDRGRRDGVRVHAGAVRRRRPLVRQLRPDQRRGSPPTARAGGPGAGRVVRAQDLAVATSADGDVAAVRRAALPLTGAADDYDALLSRIGDATLVLLGEASHGTHEFYRIRADITRRLIEEKGFTAVAVEADWPDAYRVNRFVRGDDQRRRRRCRARWVPALSAWMWRNTDVLAFVTWLRDHNDGVADAADKVGFYGLDLYSLHASIAAVLDYLDRHDPRGRAPRALPLRLLRPVRRGHPGLRLRRHPRPGALVRGAGRRAADGAEPRRGPREIPRRTPAATTDLFFAEQNARLVRNAEAYYRSMFRGRNESWNLRDRHMMETLQALMQLRAPPDRPMKVVVWAHNSHLGDARATEMGARGELNLGQLVREHYADNAVLVGFCTHHGTVTAATDWDGPAQRKRVQPGLPAAAKRCAMRSASRSFQLRLDDATLALVTGHAAAAARDRRALPAADRTPEPLLPHRAAAAVRLVDPYRCDQCAGAAGARRALARRRRAARGLPQRAVASPTRIQPAAAYGQLRSCYCAALTLSRIDPRMHPRTRRIRCNARDPPAGYAGCRFAYASTSHLLPASSKLTCTRACAPVPS